MPSGKSMLFKRYQVTLLEPALRTLVRQVNGFVIALGEYPGEKVHLLHALANRSSV